MPCGKHVKMGTNFYLTDGKHVGKRSAAGVYCWDCGISLCKDGREHIHEYNSEWYQKCPGCGKKPENETMEESSAGRELGFNSSLPSRKTGIKSCSSFTWAVEPKSIKNKKIKDEYGRKYSAKDFEKILEECPIKFSNMIGKFFS